MMLFSLHSAMDFQVHIQQCSEVPGLQILMLGGDNVVIGIKSGWPHARHGQ